MSFCFFLLKSNCAAHDAMNVKRTNLRKSPERPSPPPGGHKSNTNHDNRPYHDDAFVSPSPSFGKPSLKALSRI